MPFPTRPTRALALLATIALLSLGGFGAATAASAADNPQVNQYSQTGTAVELEGSSLSGVTDVLFGSSPAVSFDVVSSGDITSVAPPLPVGYHEISVRTSAGTTDTGFAYLVAPPAPKITNLSRTTGSTNGGDAVIITGTNLSLIQMVSIDGPVRTYNVVSNSEIDIVTAPHAPGTSTLSVSTLGGTAQVPFTFQAPTNSAATALSISSISPSHGYIGGNTSVNIYGSGFKSVASVRFGITNAKSFKIVSDTEIDAVSPLVTTGGSMSLSVANGANSATTPWTYLYVKPWVTGVTAATSKDGDYGTIRGYGFTGVTSVTVEGQSIPIKSLSDKEIVVQSPRHRTGHFLVKVTNPAGTSNTFSFDIH